MEDDIRELQPEAVDAAIGEMKIEEGIEVQDFANGLNGYISTPTEIKRSHSSTPGLVNSRSQTPPRKQSTSQTPKSGVKVARRVGRQEGRWVKWADTLPRASHILWYILLHRIWREVKGVWNLKIGESKVADV